MSALVQWLAERLDEAGWSYNELARRAGLSSAAVSIVMTGRQNPGLDFCRGVAGALNEPPEKVLRLAGLLPARSTRAATVEEILFYYDQMTPQAQAHFLRIARALADEGEEAQTEVQDVDGAQQGDDALATT